MPDASQIDLLDLIERDLVDGTPMADALRKVVILGGQVRSSELRAWATQELNGYPDDETPLPPYRTLFAPLQADGFIGAMQVTSLTISITSLPPATQDGISNEVPLRMGIGEIERMAAESTEKGSTRLTFSGAPELARLMSHHRSAGFTRVTSVYWAVGSSALHGVVDRVKTRLAELVGELRAVTPKGAALPSHSAAAQAIEIVIHGKGSSIHLQQSGRDANTSQEKPVDDKPFWTIGRRIGAAIVGVATVVAAVIAVMQFGVGS